MTSFVFRNVHLKNTFISTGITHWYCEELVDLIKTISTLTFGHLLSSNQIPVGRSKDEQLTFNL